MSENQTDLLNKQQTPLIDKQIKQHKQYKILYNWLRIARKPYYTLSQDIALLMNLIQIPMSPSQLKMLQKIIDPKGIKKYLEQQDFIKCFLIPQDKKKLTQKQIQAAFRYVAEGQQYIEYSKLKQCLEEQGLDVYSVELILKQMGDYQILGSDQEDQEEEQDQGEGYRRSKPDYIKQKQKEKEKQDDGMSTKFDYKKFASWHFDK